MPLVMSSAFQKKRTLQRRANWDQDDHWLPRLFSTSCQGVDRCYFRWIAVPSKLTLHFFQSAIPARGVVRPVAPSTPRPRSAIVPPRPRARRVCPPVSLFFATSRAGRRRWLGLPATNQGAAPPQICGLTARALEWSTVAQLGPRSCSGRQGTEGPAFPQSHARAGRRWFPSTASTWLTAHRRGPPNANRRFPPI